MHRERWGRDRDDRHPGNTEHRQIVERDPDRNVVGLTYQYYKDTAVRSAIKESVDLLNEKAVYNGKRLDDMDKNEFEDILRRGEELRMG